MSDRFPWLLTLPRNARGRDLLIGDIHGQFSRVQAELVRVGFDPDRDRLICCGDLVDRGPDSAAAAEWLARPWFFSVMGNHDASLLHRCGLLDGRFELFIDHHRWFDALPPGRALALRDALLALPWALEVETRGGRLGVVHAEVPERYPDWQGFLAALAEDPVRSQAVSNRQLARRAVDLDADAAATGERRLGGVDWVVHGHTPRPGCRPGRLGNRLWIDTMGWYDEEVAAGLPRFTLLDVEAPLRPL